MQSSKPSDLSALRWQTLLTDSITHATPGPTAGAQVYPPAMLSYTSSTTPMVGETLVTFSAWLLPMIGQAAVAATGTAVTYTFTVDKGDGNGEGFCATLATVYGGMTATTAVAAGSATYSTPGAKNAVLRVYTDAVCAPGSAPEASATPAAVGTVGFQVRSEPLPLSSPEARSLARAT